MVVASWRHRWLAGWRKTTPAQQHDMSSLPWLSRRDPPPPLQPTPKPLHPPQPPPRPPLMQLGSLPGAINVPLSTLRGRIAAGDLPQDRRLYVYCQVTLGNTLNQSTEH